jgi:hypothetical protein
MRHAADFLAGGGVEDRQVLPSAASCHWPLMKSWVLG